MTGDLETLIEGEEKHSCQNDSLGSKIAEDTPKENILYVKSSVRYALPVDTLGPQGGAAAITKGRQGDGTRAKAKGGVFVDVSAIVRSGNMERGCTLNRSHI